MQERQCKEIMEGTKERSSLCRGEEKNHISILINHHPSTGGDPRSKQHNVNSCIKRTII